VDDAVELEGVQLPGVVASEAVSHVLEQVLELRLVIATDPFTRSAAGGLVSGSTTSDQPSLSGTSTVMTRAGGSSCTPG
jgi:hypothetical protein